MGTGFESETVTLHVLLYLVPLYVNCAVIVAEPFAFAVIVPPLDTVATLVLDELHDTDCPLGVVVAVSVVVLPTVNVLLVEESVIDGVGSGCHIA